MNLKEKILLALIAFIFLFILAGFIENNRPTENLVGYGTVYGISTNPSPHCNASNNCFPGFYNRTQVYQNMCEPLDVDKRGLLRDKRQLVDGCVKTLGNNMVPLPKNIHCELDSQNQRRCYIRSNK